MAFPVLSGQDGQTEPVQALLESAGVPFVGPPAPAVALRDRTRSGCAIKLKALKFNPACSAGT